MAKDLFTMIQELYPQVRDGVIKKVQGTCDEGDIIVYSVGETTRIDIKKKGGKRGS